MPPGEHTENMPASSLAGCLLSIQLALELAMFASCLVNCFFRLAMRSSADIWGSSFFRPPQCWAYFVGPQMSISVWSCLSNSILALWLLLQIFLRLGKAPSLADWHQCSIKALYQKAAIESWNWATKEAEEAKQQIEALEWLRKERTENGNKQ